ncbi:MAG: hypothetical protein NT067_01885 [Candidatus Diapherotrites archaeon]|nr:hypothetical protein [Candidatus Diapherotrites archaeon]
MQLRKSKKRKKGEFQLPKLCLPKIKKLGGSASPVPPSPALRLVFGFLFEFIILFPFACEEVYKEEGYGNDSDHSDPWE